MGPGQPLLARARPASPAQPRPCPPPPRRLLPQTHDMSVSRGCRCPVRESARGLPNACMLSMLLNGHADRLPTPMPTPVCLCGQTLFSEAFLPVLAQTGRNPRLSERNRRLPTGGPASRTSRRPLVPSDSVFLVGLKPLWPLRVPGCQALRACVSVSQQVSSKVHDAPSDASNATATSQGRGCCRSRRACSALGLARR